MLRTAIVTTGLLIGFAVSAQAMDKLVPCTKAEMKAVEMMVHKSQDEAAMKMAMHDMDMAKKMAAAGKFHDCRMDLTKAMMAVEPK
jgi:hypothetical protein